MPLTGHIHRMASGAFAREMLRRFTPVWVWVGVALAAIAVVAGMFVDYRWSVIGLLVILVLMPPVVAFAYYSHALCRECFVNTTPHTIGADHRGLVVTLYIAESEEEADEEVAESDAANIDAPAEVVKDKREHAMTYRKLREEIFAPSQISGWYLTGSGGMADITGSHRGFVWVPFDAFGSQEAFARFAETMRNHVRLNRNSAISSDYENTQRL